MSEQDSKVCSGGAKLIFACSGAADVGAVADQAARRMTTQGAGSMFCLAGIGGRVAPIMEKTKSASQILAIDGCPLDCVAATLRQAGVENFAQLRVTDLGLGKGSTPVNDASIETVVAKGLEMVGGDANSVGGGA
jgi:uncharacterized metal-binding protein